MNKRNSIHMRSLSSLQELKTSFGFSLITFYISDHGFGHASRNIPIIGYILEENLDIRVIVKTCRYQGDFIKNVLGKYKSRLDIYS